MSSAQTQEGKASLDDGEDEIGDYGSEDDDADDYASERVEPDDDYEAYSTKENTLPSLPQHLKLPLELEFLILDFHKGPWDDLWVIQRLVCTAWRDRIEARARDKWLHRAYLHFDNGYDYDDDVGKLYLSSNWSFQHLQDDGTAVFQDTVCADKYKKRVYKACKDTVVPDVVLGHYVFNILIPGMTFDWRNMTARVHWRSLVSTICAEEAAVWDVFREGERELHRRALAVRRSGVDMDFQAIGVLVRAFADNLDNGYRTVNRRRYGYDDPEEFQRMKEFRFIIGLNSIDSDDEDGIRNDEEGNEDEGENQRR